MLDLTFWNGLSSHPTSQLLGVAIWGSPSPIHSMSYHLFLSEELGAGLDR